MSKRKGLSLEEKRDKVLEVFTASADVFVLKVSGLPQPVSVWASAKNVKGAGLPKHRHELAAPDTNTSYRLSDSFEQPEVLSHKCAKQQLMSAVLHVQDVEKLASKKGVVLQTIKEVLQVGEPAAVIALTMPGTRHMW
jgi:hypothetical protein